MAVFSDWPKALGQLVNLGSRQLHAFGIPLHFAHENVPERGLRLAVVAPPLFRVAGHGASLPEGRDDRACDCRGKRKSGCQSAGSRTVPHGGNVVRPSSVAIVKILTLADRVPIAVAESRGARGSRGATILVRLWTVRDRLSKFRARNLACHCRQKVRSAPFAPFRGVSRDSVLVAVLAATFGGFSL